MLFSFELLITNCIADPTFTNRLEQSKVRGILSQLLAKVAEYSTYTLKQLQEKDRHFHFIEQKKEKDFVITKIAKYHRKRKNLVRLLPDSRLCQLSLGPEKERVIGILQQINNSQKHPERNHLF
jgi:hypothetical protein